jgi:tyrosyl-tRNA synthetase
MTLSEELKWRGFINQTTIKDLSILDGQVLTFYHGFDASADSQTVGNLAAMMLDRAFLRHGHKAILLAGGATSLIGDPGGKDTERPLQDEQTVARNVEMAEQQLKRVFTGYDFTPVNNLDWFKDMSVLHFLRDIGKHFSMTPLVQRDYIAKRIGEDSVGISYTEFSYTLLQGYDFLKLFEDNGVTLQLSGADQWGNCLSGVELVRRVKGKEVNALTCPLIINEASGKKFGKTEEGAVWLDPEKTSPTQFYQFWINADDAGVEKYLKIFTELGREEIEQIMAEHKTAPQERKAQTRLAEEVTALVHGKDAVEFAKKITGYLTSQVSLNDADDASIQEIRKALPSVKVQQNGSVVEALVQSGLAESNGEARRLLAGNAVYVNNSPITKENFEASDFQNNRLLLRRGKALKDSALIELA